MVLAGVTVFAAVFTFVALTAACFIFEAFRWFVVAITLPVAMAFAVMTATVVVLAPVLPVGVVIVPVMLAGMMPSGRVVMPVVSQAMSMAVVRIIITVSVTVAIPVVAVPAMVVAMTACQQKEQRGAG